MAEEPFFTLFFPRHPLTTEWVSGLLQFLWEHGLDYDHTQNTLISTWEDALSMPIWELNATAPYPLQEVIDKFVQQGFGSLHVNDHKVTFTLFMDPDNRYPPLFDVDMSKRIYGTIDVFIDRAHINYDDMGYIPNNPKVNQIVFSEQVFVTYIHWCKQLCHYLQPTFGIGYYDELDPTIFHDEINTQLAMGKIPNVSPFLSNEKVMYLSPELVNQESVNELIANPNVLLQKQRNGGIFKITYPDTYEHHTVERIYLQLDMAVSEHRYQDAARLYLRAWQVAEVNHLRFWQGRINHFAEVIHNAIPDVSLPTLS
jgi:hypothetical protein